MPDVAIDTVTVGAYESNCHILHPVGESEALVIDPGGDAEVILALLREKKLSVSAYLITHGHVDHVSALAEVSEAFPAPIGMTARDASWAFRPEAARPPWYPTVKKPAKIDRFWLDGQTWTDACMRYRVIETPGHSPGSVSFYFEDHALLFPGDVLFAGSIGRTDLPGGDPMVLFGSLQRLLRLPDETRVYAGHRGPTTIGRERRTNPFLQNSDWVGSGWSP